MARKDETGNRYGRLLVVAPAIEKSHGAAMWQCACDCGNMAVVAGTLMRKGSTTSCGCYQKEQASIRRKLSPSPTTSHGMCVPGRVTRTWRAWAGMKQRCGNPNNKSYADYGGRGVFVCDRWVNSFENFFADMGEAPPKMTLERKDVNGNYEPSNCCWADKIEQANNRRSNRRLTLGDETKTLAQWARHFNVKYTKLQVLCDTRPFYEAVRLATA